MTSKTDAIKALKAHAATGAPTDMRAAFARDANRFETHSARLDDMLLDWSKCRVDGETVALLEALADACDVDGRRAAMFAGEAINTTEGRAVLHTALRNRSGDPVMVDGADVMPAVNAVLAAMADFCHGVRDGAIRGATGEPIADVVNIGIGGSDLGPAMAVRALSPFHDGPRCHFVSNVDGADIGDTLAGLDPAQVEEWYLIVFADAYEWVELPNVHGMVLFADGGVLGSKPYAASGAYIDRMSDYCGRCSYEVSRKEGERACPFNYLYWNFLIENEARLSGNPRLAMPYRTLARMSEARRSHIAADAARFLGSLSAEPVPQSGVQAEMPI